MEVQCVHKWCREFDSGQVNVKDEKKKEWSAFYVCWTCLRYWCSSADRHTCKYCSIGIKVQSFSRHHLGHNSWKSQLQESLLQVSSSSSDWWTQKDIRGIIPDVPSMKHPHSPSTKKDKTVQFPASVMANVFWDKYGVLLVNFTPSGWKINAAAYQGTLKQTQTGS